MRHRLFPRQLDLPQFFSGCRVNAQSNNVSPDSVLDGRTNGQWFVDRQKQAVASYCNSTLPALFQSRCPQNVLPRAATPVRRRTILGHGRPRPVRSGRLRPRLLRR